MAELKTQKNKASVTKFLKSVENEQKREDSLKLLKIFEEASGEKAAMWGDSIVGFGEYEYKSQRSSQAGKWFPVGFSPRKANISLYIMAMDEYRDTLIKELGKVKTTKGCCIYVKKLDDIDISILKKLIKASMKSKMPWQV